MCQGAVCHESGMNSGLNERSTDAEASHAFMGERLVTSTEQPSVQFLASPQPNPVSQRASVGTLRVALAEDNPGDVFLVREALAFHNVKAQLTVKTDGEEMLHFIQRIESGDVPCPDVVLLDLNLPKYGGEALLKRMRESPACNGVPVVIVTSSDSPKDRQTAAQLGASSYFRKPTDFDEFLKLGAIVKSIVNDRID